MFHASMLAYVGFLSIVWFKKKKKILLPFTFSNEVTSCCPKLCAPRGQPSCCDQ